MSARDEPVQKNARTDMLSELRAELDTYRSKVRAEILGTGLNPSQLVLDAQAYRRLADDVLATMPNPDRWDIDGDEGSILAQYVKHLATQITLASEFRVPLPDGLGGGYGELVVRRESTGSDRWAVTDGAVTGLRAWRDPDGWQYVAEVGRAEVFVYGLDEALDLAEEVARIEQERLDARIVAGRARPNTPDQVNADGSRTLVTKRACNGCGALLGDVTDAETTRAILGLPMPDVRRECPACGPTAPEPACVPVTVVAGDALCVEGECDHEPDDRDAGAQCDEVTEQAICVTHSEFGRDGVVGRAAVWPCQYGTEAGEKCTREGEATHPAGETGGDQ
ncbi:hypothetical protein ACWC4J_06615 [Streptomyces sp. NPDC001356]